MYNDIQHCYKIYFFSLQENSKVIASLRAEIEMYQRSNTELKALNQVLKDEHQALQLAFTHLEAKLRKIQVSTFN